MYTNTTAQVLSPDGDTEFFKILAGVRQGDTLAPFLFIVGLDYAMGQAVVNEGNLEFTLDRSRSRRHPAKVIYDTDFADDKALLPNALEQAQLLFSRFETGAKQTELHINHSKKECIKFNQGEGESLKNVNDFLYLVSWIDCCLKMLRVVKNVTWRQRITNEVLHAGLPRISTTVRERLLRFSGLC